MYYHETYTLLRIIRERELIGQFVMGVEALYWSSISVTDAVKVRMDLVMRQTILQYIQDTPGHIRTC